MSAILKAVYSHYIAQKDRIMFELDNCINKSGNDAVGRAIHLFKELSDTERVIETVKLNIEFNNKKAVNEVQGLIKKIEQVTHDVTEPEKT